MQILFFGSALLGSLGICFLLVPLGYLIGYSSRIGGFLSLPLSQQVLWSACLSTPVAILLPVLLEPALSVAALGWLETAIAIGGWAFLIRNSSRTPRLPQQESRYVRYGLLLASFLALYVMLAGLPVRIGGHIYESMSIVDLSVRVPLVDMATQHGQPVINPFDNVFGHTVNLRYYYYWYLFCGVAGRLFHLPPRATQTASGVWALLLLLSAGFLAFSSLFRPEDSRWSIRRLCLLTVPVGCVIGLDLIWMGLGLLHHPPNIYPDPDFWRSATDYSPSFNLAMLLAPHHTAGAALCLFIFLLILPSADIGLLGADAPETKRTRIARYIMAGICLAALLGTSTFMAMFACFTGLILLIDRFRARDRTTAWSILASASLGVLISVPFLAQLAHTSAHTQVADKASRFPFHLAFHAWGYTDNLLQLFLHLLHLHLHGVAAILARVGVWWIMLLTELGFFAIVLYIRVRDDWQHRATLPPRRRYQWMLFFGIFLPGFFLSSATIVGSNDISRHAGVAMRVVAVLWATPIVADWIGSPQKRHQLVHTWVGRFALILVALGLSTELYQVIGQRFYSVIREHSALISGPDYRQQPSPSALAYQLFQGFHALDAPNVAPGAVLYDPLTTDNSFFFNAFYLLNLYQTRPAVAGEIHCMTAFGGDVEECNSAMNGIAALFGEQEQLYLLNHPPAADAPAASSPATAPATLPLTPEAAGEMSTAAMDSLCRQHHAAAVLATRKDEAWQNRKSFIWTAKPLYEGDQVRVLACPTS